MSCRRVSACLQKFEKIPPVCGLKGRGWCTLGPPERGGAAYLGVFVVRPLVLADLGVHLVAPALRALLPGPAVGHFLSDGGPAVAVLGLRGVRWRFVS